MKSSLKITLVLLLTALLSSCAWVSKRPDPPYESLRETKPETAPVTDPETEPETAPETVPETEPETIPETEPETVPETEPETVPETEPETEPFEKPAKVPGAEITGYTSKGYPIEVKNGVPYIDGQVIANKTYSLPADYYPALDYEYDGDPFPVTPETRAAFNRMCADAMKAGVTEFDSCSSFRSYGLQEYLYNSYIQSHGKEQADRFSARPGHSEHETGLAIDINFCNTTFETTDAGIWLAAHCCDYGFIIRYPKGKESVTGYMYEPWHVRYIGSPELCRAITEAGTMEEYYGFSSVYPD